MTFGSRIARARKIFVTYFISLFARPTNYGALEAAKIYRTLNVTVLSPSLAAIKCGPLLV